MKKKASVTVRTSGKWATVCAECANGGGTTSFLVEPGSSHEQIQNRAMSVARAIWPFYDLDMQGTVSTL